MLEEPWALGLGGGRGVPVSFTSEADGTEAGEALCNRVQRLPPAGQTLSWCLIHAPGSVC